MADSKSLNQKSYGNEAAIFQFDNTYVNLPEFMYSRVQPVPVRDPQLVVYNKELAEDLGISFASVSEQTLPQHFSGNELPKGAEPIAQAYAGHQFGNFTMLGDGRAHLLGEHVTTQGSRFDIQLKGSGKTPYGRRGDGRAALGPMLREYIISEAMHGLGIPTSRSLAVVTTGEPVYRETSLPGAILTRVASSHIRVGTFEFVAAQRDISALKQLADYSIARHYPHLSQTEKPYLALLTEVRKKQTKLITEWLRVGFIHGVMNTDNMTVSGETIDYGPCAFMDSYDPATVFSSIDHMGRYAFAQQPGIVQWNLARLAEAILPLLHENIDKAVELAEEEINAFSGRFQHEWLAMMRRKCGLKHEKPDDDQLISELLEWMHRHEMDYTNTFRELASPDKPAGKYYETEQFTDWWNRWQNRLSDNEEPPTQTFERMNNANPALIPRNHQVEKALRQAEDYADFTYLHSLLDALTEPYEDKSEYTEFKTPPAPEERVYQTFCGT
jgi:uncharacterized protein YdiU (UPF0061 family)